MTVIVGLEASVNGEKAVVIGADRLNVNGDLSVTQFLKYIQSENPNDLSYGFDFLKRRKMDKIKLKLGRKIKISRDKDAVLAHTGLDNETNKQVSKLLLSPNDFLKQDSFLIELLYPFEVNQKISKQILRDYKVSFNLEKSLRKGYVPEIRRIFDLSVAKKHEINSPLFKLAWWDRNYNTTLSEYLFSRAFDIDDKSKILLLDISLTGALTRRQYYAKGCGGKYALEYMRKRLGTKRFEFFYDTESPVERDIHLDEAVDIVINAVNFANGKSDFCKGLDYVILTPKGANTHFSNGQGEYEIDIFNLIDKRISSLQGEVKQLRNIKREYNNLN